MNNFDLNIEVKASRVKINEIINKLFFQVQASIEENTELCFQLELVTRELLANAIQHGCQFDLDVININFKYKCGQLSLSVQDPGPGFNWQNYDFSTMPLLTETGRGLPLVNSVVKAIKFNQRGNKVTVFFKSDLN